MLYRILMCSMGLCRGHTLVKRTLLSFKSINKDKPFFYLIGQEYGSALEWQATFLGTVKLFEVTHRKDRRSCVADAVSAILLRLI